jgi:cellulose synthase/poly-beta-1,6-N-acetylglucosamine synthase-like glycosyltransferase
LSKSVAALILNVVAWFLAAALLLFSLRRVALMLAAWVQPRPIGASRNIPTVTLLIPARNEEAGIAGTLTAVAALDYPTDQLFTVLIDDGSEDGTRMLCERWVAARERALVISFSGSRGKIAALNAGVAAAPPTELIAVCDADVKPKPDWLRRLADAFADERVGGAAALLRPVGADRTAVSRYAAVENWVNQLVTSAGKDRLGLNPVTNGASAYRRTALEGLGWFGVGFSEDDVRATVGLTRAGWRTRLVPTAIIEHAVVYRFSDYWRQHIRWSGNLMAAATAPKSSNHAHVGLWRTLETWVVFRGYVDRVVLLAVIGLVLGGRLPLWIPGLYLATVVGYVITALVKARTGRRFFGFLFWTTAFYGIDIVASFAAVVGLLERGPHMPPRADA